jgi:uncharacterized protein with HEPN domain
MLEAIANCRSYAQGLSLEQFLANRMTTDAMLYNLQIIGEAAAHIPEDVRRAYPKPWEKMIAMRNRIVHGYTTVDLELVWKTVEVNLDPLERRLREMQAGLADEWKPE